MSRWGWLSSRFFGGKHSTLREMNFPRNNKAFGIMPATRTASSQHNIKDYCNELLRMLHIERFAVIDLLDVPSKLTFWSSGMDIASHAFLAVRVYFRTLLSKSSSVLAVGAGFVYLKI